MLWAIVAELVVEAAYHHVMASALNFLSCQTMLKEISGGLGPALLLMPKHNG
jgi:hypothetical protein